MHETDGLRPAAVALSLSSSASKGFLIRRRVSPGRCVLQSLAQPGRSAASHLIQQSASAGDGVRRDSGADRWEVVLHSLSDLFPTLRPMLPWSAVDQGGSRQTAAAEVELLHLLGSLLDARDDVRRKAERQYELLRRCPDFLESLATLVTAATGLPLPVRLVGAVCLKNSIAYVLLSSDVAKWARAAIASSILFSMHQPPSSSGDSAIFLQLSLCLARIVGFDGFSSHWPLLQQLLVPDRVDSIPSLLRRLDCFLRVLKACRGSPSCLKGVPHLDIVIGISHQCSRLWDLVMSSPASLCLPSTPTVALTDVVAASAGVSVAEKELPLAAATWTRRAGPSATDAATAILRIMATLTVHFTDDFSQVAGSRSFVLLVAEHAGDLGRTFGPAFSTKSFKFLHDLCLAQPVSFLPVSMTALKETVALLSWSSTSVGDGGASPDTEPAMAAKAVSRQLLYLASLCSMCSPGSAASLADAEGVLPPQSAAMREDLYNVIVCEDVLRFLFQLLVHRLAVLSPADVSLWSSDCETFFLEQERSNVDPASMRSAGLHLAHALSSLASSAVVPVLLQSVVLQMQSTQDLADWSSIRHLESAISLMTYCCAALEETVDVSAFVGSAIIPLLSDPSCHDMVRLTGFRFLSRVSGRLQQSVQAAVLECCLAALEGGGAAAVSASMFGACECIRQTTEHPLVDFEDYPELFSHAFERVVGLVCRSRSLEVLFYPFSCLQTLVVHCPQVVASSWRSVLGLVEQIWRCVHRDVAVATPLLGFVEMLVANCQDARAEAPAVLRLVSAILSLDCSLVVGPVLHVLDRALSLLVDDAPSAEATVFSLVSQSLLGLVTASSEFLKESVVLLRRLVMLFELSFVEAFFSFLLSFVDLCVESCSDEGLTFLMGLVMDVVLVLAPGTPPPSADAEDRIRVLLRDLGGSLMVLTQVIIFARGGSAAADDDDDDARKQQQAAVAPMDYGARLAAVGSWTGDPGLVQVLEGMSAERRLLLRSVLVAMGRVLCGLVLCRGSLLDVAVWRSVQPLALLDCLWVMHQEAIRLPSNVPAAVDLRLSMHFLLPAVVCELRTGGVPSFLEPGQSLRCIYQLQQEYDRTYCPTEESIHRWLAQEDAARLADMFDDNVIEYASEASPDGSCMPDETSVPARRTWTDVSATLARRYRLQIRESLLDRLSSPSRQAGE